MYQRERRRFTKMVLDQHQKLGHNAFSEKKYHQENRRLREYCEALFLALHKKKVTILKDRDVLFALQRMQVPLSHQPQMQFVANLALTALKGDMPTQFTANYRCSICGGNYALKDDHYQCDSCLSVGKADQNGFPNSFPACSKVRHGRRVFHDNVRKIVSMGVNTEEAYMLIAYVLKTPLPMVHAGYCVTEQEINTLIAASHVVIDKLERELKESVC
ncbi:hypothetical protein M3914_003112 [Vibrio metschnikovii]|nr:hypothetical protein [Vibrio metschnikovii]